MKLSNYAAFSVVGLQLILTFLVLEIPQTAVAQDDTFSLPVQLVGFPVIILAVRLSNFVKKLAYSLNPNTYRSRVRRGAISGPYDESTDHLDAAEAEKKLVAEMGENVCIYERICAHYAQKTKEQRASGHIDWETVLSHYKRSPDKTKEFYLLSVFLGNIVGSPNLCHQLAKRGRACPPLGSWEQR